MAIFAHDYSETLTLDETAEHGVVTNGNADEAITLELPDGAPAATQFIIHNVADFPLTVAGENPGTGTGGQIWTGEGHGNSATLASRGSTLEIFYTGPHSWTGVAQGCSFE